MRSRTYSVYVLTNTARTVLYVGVTGNLLHRVLRHRAGDGSAFCRRYRLWRLVHVEHFVQARLAIEREKALKRWSRRRKARLVGDSNPGWEDLAEALLGLAPFAWGSLRADRSGGLRPPRDDVGEETGRGCHERCDPGPRPAIPRPSRDRIDEARSSG